jgi:hypothetical protein
MDLFLVYPSIQQVHNSHVCNFLAWATMTVSMVLLKRRRRQALEVSRLCLSRSFGSDDDPFMANLAFSSRDIVSAEEEATIPDPSRDTIDTASPELVAQVSHLEALLSCQQTELNDLVETESKSNFGQEEEDDDLAVELADLAESEALLRRELEQLADGQLKPNNNNNVWMTSVQDDLNNDRKRGWGLWHLTICASLATAIIATIMLSKPVVIERQSELSRNTLVVAGPPQVPDDMDSTLEASEQSLSDCVSPYLRVFDLSTAESSVRRPGKSEASAAISVASKIPVISVTPSCRGQTTILAGSNTASVALAIIPANLPFYSSVAPIELATIESSWQAYSQIQYSLGVLASATFPSNHLQSRLLVRSHPLLPISPTAAPPSSSAPETCSARTDSNLVAKLKRSQALDTVKLYDTQTNLSLSLISFLSWNMSDPVAASSRPCRSESGLDVHLERKLLAGAIGTSITSCGCRCQPEIMGTVQRTDEASVGVALTATSSYAERFAPAYYDFERPPASQSQQGQEGADWKQRFTKAILLLTATWSYADRFSPAIGEQHA